MKFGIDLDGVLADWVTSFSALLAQKFGEKQLDLSTWDWPQASGYSTPQVEAAWTTVADSENFWKALPKYPTTEADLFWLHKRWVMGDDIYFITSRPGHMVKQQSEEWLNAFNGYGAYAVPNPTVILTSQKGLVCKALGITHFVDDRIENVMDVFTQSPGTLAYLFDRPWNHSSNWPHRITQIAGSLEV
jgi:hypothetical protein